ncbi:MAG: ATP phosphoribosyltransferase [Firmicutes bacterium]|nr:ATP phosphoribosyltransferase [Bacillota bacterium]
MLSIAVAKGRLLDSFIQLLEEAGYCCQLLKQDTRQLVLEIPEINLCFILAKPADVPTYVEYGSADLGVVGKDILAETDKDVAELIDLKYGRCRLVVAVPENLRISSVQDLDFNSRVASKYPHIANDYFNSRGIQVEVIPLHGSIELGPIIGLSEAIVDITETGRTLKENGLVIIDTIMESTARLAANHISLKTKRKEISKLISDLNSVIEGVV